MTSKPFDNDEFLRISLEAISQHNNYLNGTTEMTKSQNDAASSSTVNEEDVVVPEQSTDSTRVISGIDADGKHQIRLMDDDGTTEDDTVSKLQKLTGFVKSHKKHIAAVGATAAIATIAFVKLRAQQVVEEIEGVLEDEPETPADEA